MTEEEQWANLEENLLDWCRKSETGGETVGDVVLSVILNLKVVMLLYCCHNVVMMLSRCCHDVSCPL